MPFPNMLPLAWKQISSASGSSSTATSTAKANNNNSSSTSHIASDRLPKRGQRTPSSQTNQPMTAKMGALGNDERIQNESHAKEETLKRGEVKRKAKKTSEEVGIFFKSIEKRMGGRLNSLYQAMKLNNNLTKPLPPKNFDLPEIWEIISQLSPDLETQKALRLINRRVSPIVSEQIGQIGLNMHKEAARIRESFSKEEAPIKGRFSKEKAWIKKKLVKKKGDFEESTRLEKKLKEKLDENIGEKIDFLRKTGMKARLNLTIDVPYTTDISKILPADIRHLKLNSASLTASDIESLPNFSHLESLDLSGIELSSEALTALLKKVPAHIKHLNLRGCKGLTDAHLEALSYFDQLEFLDLSKLKFSAEPLAELSSEALTALLKKMPTYIKHLNLSGCKGLTDIHLEALLHFDQLEFLDVSRPKFSAEPLAENLAEFSSEALTALLKKVAGHIKHLNLSGRKELANTHLDLEGLPNFDQLKFLDLNNIDLSSETLTALLKTIPPHVKHLNLSECLRLADAHLKALLRFNQLEFLDLSRTSLSGEALTALLKKVARHIKHLNLGGCMVWANANLEGLPDFDQLEFLDLSNSGISVANFVKLLNKAPHIKRLNLSGSMGWANANLDGLLDFNQLEFLDLSYSDISDAALDKLLNKTPHIKHLKLRRCRQMTDANLSRLPRLEFLDFSDSLISSASPFKLLKRAPPHLKHLNLKECKWLAYDAGLEELPGLDQLEFLDLSDSAISSKNLIELLNKAPHIKHLNLDWCFQLTNVPLEKLLDFDQLEFLRLKRSAISAESCATILSKMPYAEIYD